MPREVYLTAQDALAAAEELECDENETLDIVFAPPEVAVVSVEEDLDKNNLTEGNTDLPDAPGEIELHYSVLPKLRLQQKNLPRKDVKNTMLLRRAIIVQASLLPQSVMKIRLLSNQKFNYVKSRQRSYSKNFLIAKSWHCCLNKAFSMLDKIIGTDLLAVYLK